MIFQQRKIIELLSMGSLIVLNSLYLSFKAFLIIFPALKKY